MDGILELIKEVNGITYYRNADLSRYSTIRIGGKADVVFCPRTKHDMTNLLFLIGKYSIPYTVVGQGSNILFSDGGYKGVIVSTKDMRTVRIKDNRVYAMSGARLINVLADCTEANLGGLEFVCGIPASVGGAVRMNAGAYGSEIGNSLLCVDVYTDGGTKRLYSEEMDISYRHTNLSRTDVILQAVFELERTEKEQIEEKVAGFKAHRQETQPSEPSLGCIFKSVSGVSAAKYIDELRLKGMRIGDAEISSRHAGFIVNKGKASCDNVVRLIDRIKDEVYSAYGIQLEEEIIRIG